MNNIMHRHKVQIMGVGGKGTDGQKGYKERIIIFLFTRAMPGTQASHHIRHKVLQVHGSQPGDCRWLLIILLGLVHACMGEVKEQTSPLKVHWKSNLRPLEVVTRSKM